MERPDCKIILEVGITADGKFAMILLPGAGEKLLQHGLLQCFGESLAAFGEQIRMNGLGVTKKPPSGLYGPNGRPV